MIQASPESAALFAAKTPEALIAEVRERHGDAVARIFERLDVKKLSIEEQNQIITELHDAGLNGNAEPLLMAYKTKLEQMEVKKTLDKTWLQSAWETTGDALSTAGSVIAWPFKKAWEQIKAHPYITGTIVLGILAFLAYQYGIPLAQFAGEGGDAGTAEVAEAMQQLANTPPGGDLPTATQLPPTTGVYPQIQIEMPDLGGLPDR